MLLKNNKDSQECRSWNSYTTWVIEPVENNLKKIYKRNVNLTVNYNN